MSETKSEREQPLLWSLRLQSCSCNWINKDDIVFRLAQKQSYLFFFNNANYFRTVQMVSYQQRD